MWAYFWILILFCRLDNFIGKYISIKVYLDYFKFDWLEIRSYILPICNYIAFFSSSTGVWPQSLLAGLRQ